MKRTKSCFCGQKADDTLLCQYHKTRQQRLRRNIAEGLEIKLAYFQSERHILAHRLGLVIDQISQAKKWSEKDQYYQKADTIAGQLIKVDFKIVEFEYLLNSPS